MRFEWNPAKADRNLKKHGIAFSEAASVFGDPLSDTFPDPEQDRQLPARDGIMRTRKPERTDELRAEYDFAAMKGAVRGKYSEQYRKGTNLVLLAPDVAEIFHDPAAVNDALRSLIDIARAQVPPRKAAPTKVLRATAAPR